jgi:Meiotically up-regulated gene 113
MTRVVKTPLSVRPCPFKPERMVYFIQGENSKLVKIGMTTNLGNRLRELQAASPDRLKVLAVILHENHDGPRHQQFRDAWAYGEWFRPTPELMASIESLPPFRGKRSCEVQNRRVNPKPPTPPRQSVERERIEEDLIEQDPVIEWSPERLAEMERLSKDAGRSDIWFSKEDVVRKNPFVFESELTPSLENQNAI